MWDNGKVWLTLLSCAIGTRERQEMDLLWLINCGLALDKLDGQSSVWTEIG